MVLSRRRCLLEVERLENRLTPAACLDQPLVTDCSSDTSDDTTIVADVPGDPGPVITPIDPTADPVNSGNTTVVATVTGVETPNSSGLVFSITVSGLTPQNVQALSTISFTVPSGTTYTVDAVFQQDNGDYALVVLGGIDATGIDAGSTLVITIGNGGEIPPPPLEVPPDDPTDLPVIPPIDPTGDPTTDVSVVDYSADVSTNSDTSTTESTDTTTDTFSDPASVLTIE
jgi:hypothetical protein